MDDEEVISEQEADALLEGVATGTVGTSNDAVGSPAKAVPYDFADQDHIQRGHMAMLDAINQRFTHRFQDELSSFLERAAKVSAQDLRTIKFEDYARDLGTPAHLNLISIKPLHGTAILVFEPKLIFTIVDYFFGGNGQHQDQMESRELTPTEIGVMNLVLNQMLIHFKGAWEQVMPVDFEYLKLEIDPQFSDIASASEPMILSSFQVELGESGSELSLALPLSMLEPIREILEGGRQQNKSDTERHRLQLLQQRVQESTLEVRATFGDTDLSLREVYEFEVGDVIPLTLRELAILQVGDVPVYRCQFGVHQGKNAVKIISPVTDSNSSQLST